MAVSGLNRLMRRFEQLPKEIQEDVKDIIEEETLAIQREAIQNAPAAGDSLSTTVGSCLNHAGNKKGCLINVPLPFL